MKRIVLDTNILISALFWEGPPRTIYKNIRRGNLELLICKEIEEEISRVLAYPKFQLPIGAICALLGDIQSHSTPVRLRSDVQVITEDRSDNIFLACALDGKANAIISGDSHLLELKNFRNIPIYTARDFVKLEKLEAK